MAQIIDDFSDGDLTENPEWSDPLSHFIVSAGNELQLNNQAASGSGAFFSHLSTPLTALGNTTWEFNIRMNLNPSSSNFSRVYLVSDNSNLLGALNGYFVLVGGTDDQISLFRQTGTTASSVISGTPGSVNSPAVNVRVKVERSVDGNWSLYRDLTGGSTYVLEGTEHDLTHVSSAYFGFYIRYSSGNKTNYFFDNILIKTGLSIDTVVVNSNTAVTIKFNQNVNILTAEAAENYSIDNGTSVSSAIRSVLENDEVTLVVSDLSTGTYELTVDGVTDDLTQTLPDNPLVAQFSYTQLALVNIITTSFTEITLVFNDSVDPLQAIDPSNYVIDGGIGTPTNAVVNPTNNKEVFLTLPAELTEQPYSLTFPDAFSNLTGNSELGAGTSFDFGFVVPLIAGTLEVMSKNQVKVTFNKTLNEGQALNPANYALNNEIGAAVAVALDDSGKEVTLTFATFSESDYALTITNLTDHEGTELAPDPTLLEFSYLPLEVDAVEVTSENTLEVTFNQAFDQSATFVANYTLSDGFGHPVSAAVSSGNKLELTFSASFVNYTYQLTIDGVPNASGNSLAENIEIDVVVSKATTPGSLIINEVLADPNPKGLMPGQPVLPTASGAEFVELYNPGNFSIDIGGFNLTGGVIGTYSLAPGAYVALVPVAYVSDYQAIGPAVAISGWNTLTNTGETIILKDQFGNAIDEVAFSDSWLDDVEKDGGWSLEKINPRPSCESSDNWKASVDPKGATPGAQNSIFDGSSDLSSPEIISVEFSDTHTLLIHFNEKMETRSADYFTISLEGIEVTGQVFPDDNSFSIELASPLQSERHYQLQLEGIQDCSGNVLEEYTFNFYYDTKPPVPQEITLRSLKSLVLEFDEPVNETDAEKEENYVIELLNSHPAKATLNNLVPRQVLLEFDSEFAFDSEYGLTVSGLKDTVGNVMVDPSTILFEVAQHIDTVVVEGPNYLKVVFDKSVAEELLVDAGNYLLQEEDTPLKAIRINDKEVRLIFAKDFSENKDLVLSVTGLADENGNGLITPDYTFYYDTKAPVLEDAKTIDASKLLLTFNEKLEPSSAEAIANYNWAGQGYPESAELMDGQRSVELVFNEAFPLEVNQEIAVVSLRDIYGNQIARAVKKSFYYDTLAPRASSLSVISPKKIEIEFSEPVTRESSEKPGSYSIASQQPWQAKRLLPDSNRVELSFAETIPSLDGQKLLVGGVIDFADNTIDELNIDFDNQNLTPGKVNILSETSLEVWFNKDLGTGFSKANVAAEALAVSSVSLGSEPHQLLVQFGDKMADSGKYTVHFEVITAMDGATLGEGDSLGFTYRSFVEQVSSNNPFVVEILFSVPVNEDSLGVSSLVEVHPGNFLPEILLASSEEDALVRIYFQEPLPTDEPLLLEISDFYDLWGREIPAQVHSFTIDQKPLRVDSVYSRLFRELVVVFDETSSSATALSPNHYAVLGIGEPLSAAYLADNKGRILLTFENDFEDRETYQLAVQNVEDAAGNRMETDTITFDFIQPVLPQYGDIIITEVLADPTPSAGLPEVEYVELFNNSSDNFDRSTITFSKDDKEFKLGEGTLDSGTYLLLCAVADTSYLEQFGEVVGLKGWSGLANEGDSLTLANFLGEEIDIVVYAGTWYQGAAKDDGGYSLERVFSEQVCDPSSIWIASTSTRGGTPGAVNSVWNNPSDTIPPSLSAIKIIDASHLELTFSEAINPQSSLLLSLSPHVAVLVIEISGTTANVTLESSLSASDEYELTITKVSDCFGNASPTLLATMAIGEKVSQGDLIFTEIMADPSPVVGLPDVEYVEIYNRSDKLINLQQVVFGDEGGSRALTGLLRPEEYLVLTSSDSLSTFGKALLINGFPSLTNSGERLTLADTSGTIIDDVAYETGWYHNPAKDDGGYSLERIFSEPVCEASLNWAASTDTSGGTPGSVNSVWNNPTDTIPPFLSRVAIVNASHLQLMFSEAINPQSSLLLSLSPQVGVLVIEISGTTANVTLESPLSASEEYELTITKVSDCFGNTSPTMATTVAIGERVSPGELIFTEIMADPSPVVGLPDVEYVEIYNTSDKLINLQQVVFGDEGSSRPLTGLLRPEEYLVVTSSDSLSNYRKVLLVSGFPSLTNSGELLTLSDTTGAIIDEVNFELSWYRDNAKNDGGYSLERVFSEPVCDPSSNWIASTSTRGGTPGAVNSVWNNPLDTIPPSLSAIKIIDASHLELTFSEAINPQSSLLLSLSPHVAVLVIEISGTTANVTLESSLSASDEYELTITKVSDCFGNASPTMATTVAIGERVSPGDLIFTEIMADPSPVVGLPNAEYVEIYNRSEKLINLQQVVFGDESSSRPLTGLLKPEEYLVLTSSDSLSTFGKVLLTNGFPSLTNSGERLSLADTLGTIIDDVAYETGWYHNPAKDDGGYSLERIFSEPVCEASLNWTASTSTRGGTPGAVNSVWNNPKDILPPLLSSIDIVDARHLRARFSEAINPSSELGISCTPSIEVTSIGLLEGHTLSVKLESQLSSSDVYELNIIGVSDCFGNTSPTMVTTIAIGEKVNPGDLIFTEIMADPSPVVGLPNVEYVEIYNRSDKLINLQQVLFSDEGSGRPLTGLLRPDQYLVLTGSDSLATFGEVLRVSGFPSLTNSGELLTLSDTTGTIIDEVNFELGWYRDASKDDGGYSLERVNLHLVCSGSDNWRASIDSSGGTPSLVNSVYGSAPDTTPPKVLTLGAESQQIFLSFSETVTLGSSEFGGISISNGPAIAAIELTNDNRTIRLGLAEPLDFGINYIISVAAIKDCEGNEMSSVTLSFGLGREPGFGELLFSEIMADPTPIVALPEAEFIELFNPTSDWLALGSVSLAVGDKVLPLPSGQLGPGAYLVLTSTTQLSSFVSHGSVLGIPSFPALKNDGDHLALYSAGEIVHQVHYAPSLFKEAAKKDGGWSLELIDPSQPCAGAENWTGSMAAEGGTPGAPNSVLASLGSGQPARVESATATSDSTVSITLSKHVLLHNLSLEMSILPSVNVAKISFPTGPTDTLHLLLHDRLQPNTVYTLTLHRLADCNGNLTTGEAATTTFVLPAPAESLDIVINEVLFNPRSGGVDFVELYNATPNKHIDLNGWLVGNADPATGDERDFKGIAIMPKLLGPGAFAVLTSNPALLKADYPSGREQTFVEVALPTYPNEEGVVIIRDQLGETIDRFEYHEDLHFALLEEVKGVSLERRSATTPTGERENWTSAAASVGFATPGYKNSVSYEPEATEADIKAEPRAFIPGDPLSPSVTFSFGTALSNAVIDAIIYDIGGRKIKNLVSGYTISEGGFFHWDGTSDHGEVVRVGVYIVQIEFFNTAGQKQVLRTTVAVGGRF